MTSGRLRIAASKIFQHRLDLAFQPDVHEHADRQSDPCRIEQRHVAAHDATLFQLAHPTQAG